MRSALAAILTVVALFASACSSVPDSGPVKRVDLAAPDSQDEVIPYNPGAPRAGASPGEIVDGFLDAMKATPMSTSFARRYLTKEAALKWTPSGRTLVYGELGSHVGSSPRVSVELEDAGWLDDRGVWRGALASSQAILDFGLTRTDGEWRISSAPDALVIEEDWFLAHYARSNLYYVEPAGQTLVPEPIFAPKGSAYASTLVTSLLSGPGEEEQGVIRSALPANAEEPRSVNVRDGVAEVDLAGDLGEHDTEELRLMGAQLAWTLRQDTSVRSIRLTIDGEPVVIPGWSETFSVQNGGGYDPNGTSARVDLYALRGGALVTSTGEDDDPWVPVLGGWSRSHGVTDVAVDADASRAAAITADRTGVIVGGLSSDADLSSAPVTGTRLLRPTWDLAGRLWLIDKSPTGARVMYVDGDRLVRVAVPGVTGENVTRFLVSRDGTRLVAAIGGDTPDRIVVSRLRATSKGEITNATSAVLLPHPDAATMHVTDIAWTSPTTIVAVQQIGSTALFQSVSLDGAPSGERYTLSDRVTGVVGSPVLSARLYAISGWTLLDPLDRFDLALPSDLSDVTYQG
ncbi:sporulation and spore germination protein [Nocardioides albertanoniae]|uniref:Sporulation and spore germination protein n=1 Tax=Nocardioides albertanoniae TaxID=1175486 RepID=A0A543A4B6_9ACTN|nr:LpqB family beta-propeller domain-containing protein [Nocardioides albertanoniae]TQL67306.1 sporulation and spore germination protein [Nocardioides albertanoniae]